MKSVRSSTSIRKGPDGNVPGIAVAVARAAGMPVMMHLGDPPPTFEDGLAQLRDLLERVLHPHQWLINSINLSVHIV